MALDYLAPDQRPRERILREGVRSLSTAELLALLLHTGIRGEDVVTCSHRILSQRSLYDLSRMSCTSLSRIRGLGPAKAALLSACFELGRRASRSRETLYDVSSPEDVVELMRPDLENQAREHVVGLYLDARSRLIHKEILFIGSLDATVIHAREVFRVAIQESAASVILVHNHPSGDPEPSDADITITRQLAEAGAIIGIHLEDHVIVATGKHISLRRGGFLSEDPT